MLRNTVGNSIPVCMRFISCLFIVLLLLAVTVRVDASPITLNFSGQVTALDATTPQGHYDLSNLPIGPYLEGNVTYDLDPSLAVGLNNNLHPLSINVFFSDGHAANTVGNFNVGIITSNNGILDIGLVSWGVYFNKDTLPLCDPWADLAFNFNTMTGNLIIGFTDFSRGTLTCDIDKFTQSPTSPVPEPSSFILLSAGILGILVLMVIRREFYCKFVLTTSL